jgi:hypothetical protein
MMQLLIDDTGYTHGNFENIFEEDFNEISCYTSKHNQYKNVTSICYAGAFTKDKNRMDELVEEFLKEKVNFKHGYK